VFSSFHLPSIFHLWVTSDLLSVTSSSVYGFSLRASQASNVSSIPIARSRFTRNRILGSN
jgi:hypothetical protein